MTTDNNPRELIGTVILTNGDRLEIRMPTTGDVMDGAIQRREHLEVIIEAATNISIQEFRSLPAPDGFAVLNKLSVAIEAMSNYLNSYSNKKK